MEKYHVLIVTAWQEQVKHASVLFAAEANAHVKQQHFSTSLPCSWLPPSF